MGSRRRRAAGFTMLELGITICVMAVLGVVALDRVFYYQEVAEKQAMDEKQKKQARAGRPSSGKIW